MLVSSQLNAVILTWLGLANVAALGSLGFALQREGMDELREGADRDRMQLHGHIDRVGMAVFGVGKAISRLEKGDEGRPPWGPASPNSRGNMYGAPSRITAGTARPDDLESMLAEFGPGDEPTHGIPLP